MTVTELVQKLLMFQQDLEVRRYDEWRYVPVGEVSELFMNTGRDPGTDMRSRDQFQKDDNVEIVGID